MMKKNRRANRNKVKDFIDNPKKALFRLALPIMIAMLVQALYNVVDTAFVGRLGADAIAALTFSFPIFFFMMAVNSGIVVGMGSRISRSLGAKRKKDAENTALHGLGLSILAAAAIVALGLIFMEPLFRIFGAEPEVLGLALNYMSIILYGAVFMFLSFGMNNIFTAQGDTKTPMMVHIMTLALNMILDPIFIYVLGYGVKGAAIATLISFTIGFLIFVYFIITRSYLKIRFSYFKAKAKIIKDIFRVGTPAGITMLLMSFYLVFLNRFMAHFGTKYVASLGITFRFESLAVMPMVAISMALLTLTGMFYGAKRYDLLKSIIWFGIKSGTAIVAIIGFVLFTFPSVFLKIFTDDPQLIMIGAPFMRIELLTFPFMAVCMIVSRAMQGMGFGMPGLLINLMRSLILPIPLAYMLVFVFGFGYLWIACSMVAGAIAASVIAVILLKLKLKRLED